MKRIDVFRWKGEGLLLDNIKFEWSAGNLHSKSTEKQRLSKMVINTLSSFCDRPIMGEQLSKMNSVWTVSQYKCQMLRRTLSIQLSQSLLWGQHERAVSKEKQQVKESLDHRATTPGKTLLSHTSAAKLHDCILSNTHALTYALSLSSCRKEISMHLQKTSNTSVYTLRIPFYNKTP